MDPQQQPPIRVVFVLLPGSLVLDWAGPAEALRIANQRLVASGRPERFAIEFASPRPTSMASVGVALAGLSPLPAQWDGPAWVVLVGLTGQTIAIDNPETQDLLHWLRGQRFERGRVELVTVCAGAVLAAHAGALAGRRATTHHHHLDELRAVEPRCDVVSSSATFSLIQPDV
ncbi:transcriptional regulator GlxA family with amidase domain [Variovorax boronicumulans]|nr:transcriptional regulator GlxA family with amidase domain [Variovorax boronicumulans]MDQ0002897.1 transcriptional regulator GlxA family with amidase domain [Variovorax boronicumulans]